ncbi:O-antigen ligase family protein [Eubacteriales bacterium OttesenSCG-928-M02]|nr:O-antigen ligase family protein [Eubacteriales bacterium OttesenSCG-928-M02]
MKKQRVLSIFSNVEYYKRLYLLNAIFLSLLDYSPYLSGVFIVVLGVWGVALICYEARRGAISLEKKGMWLLFAFLLVVLLTTMLHIQEKFLQNMGALVIAAITFFLLYNGESPGDRELVPTAKSPFTGFLTLFLCTSLILSIITLVLFFLNIHLVSFIARYTGIYLMPSMASILAACGLFLGIHLLFQWGELSKGFRLLATCQVGVQLLVLVLSNARAGMYAFMAMGLPYILLLLIRLWKAPRMLRAITAIFLAAGLLGGMFLLYDSLGEFAYRVNHDLYALRYPGEEAPEADHPLQFQREDEAKSSEIRLNILLAGLNTFLRHPITGVSPKAISTTVQEEYHGALEDLAGIQGGSLHNGYLEVLTGTGLLGFLPLLCFAGYILLQGIISTHYLRRNTKAYQYNCYLLCTILGLAVFFLFESAMLFTMNFSETFFWVFLGRLALRPRPPAQALSHGQYTLSSL